MWTTRTAHWLADDLFELVPYPIIVRKTAKAASRPEPFTFSCPTLSLCLMYHATGRLSLSSLNIVDTRPGWRTADCAPLSEWPAERRARRSVAAQRSRHA